MLCAVCVCVCVNAQLHIKILYKHEATMEIIKHRMYNIRIVSYYFI